MQNDPGDHLGFAAVDHDDLTGSPVAEPDPALMSQPEAREGKSDPGDP